MKTVREPEKEVPVLCEADVVVAGGGMGGIFSALAAARQGATTVLVDRFGTPGGNIGPGFFVGGSLTGWPGLHVEGAFAGIPGEFLERHAAMGGGAMPPKTEAQHLRDANIASHTALTMLREAGVRLVLSAYVSDPMMQGERVCGLFVETKSGRVAIPAGVVVDATGEADVTRRAGGPALHPSVDVKDVGRSMAIMFIAGGVDWQKHDAYGDKEALEKFYVDAIERSEADGEYEQIRDVPGLGKIRTFMYQRCGSRFDGLASGYAGLDCPNSVDQGNAEHVTEMEIRIRTLCYDTMSFWKKHAPGFEESYPLLVAPYLGTRGGPSIEGEFVLTKAILDEGYRCDDVIFRFGRGIRADQAGDSEPPKRSDIPYRIMLPKKVDGLLAAGRSASSIPGSLMRTRAAVMHMGQAAGTAAALAVKDGVTPRQLDAKKLQRILVDAGFFLGDDQRLREIGLA